MDYIKLALDILRGSLGVPVVTDVPSDRPERLVMVDLEGVRSRSFLVAPRLALTCWGRTDREAHGIALSAVQALQEAALDHELLSSCDLETMSREEWSRNGQSRYLAIVELTINTDE